MNNNKAARILNFVFSFLFTSTFLFLLYQIIIKGYQYNEEINTYRCTHEEYIIIIVSAFVLSIIFAAVYYAIMLYNSTKIRRRITDNDQLTKRIIFAVVAVMLILQMSSFMAVTVTWSFSDSFPTPLPLALYTFAPSDAT